MLLLQDVVMIISAGVSPDILSGSKMVLAVAEQMGATVGDVGKWCFLIGFWGAGVFLLMSAGPGRDENEA